METRKKEISLCSIVLVGGQKFKVEFISKVTGLNYNDVNFDLLENPDCTFKKDNIELISSTTEESSFSITLDKRDSQNFRKSYGALIDANDGIEKVKYWEKQCVINDCKPFIFNSNQDKPVEIIEKIAIEKSQKKRLITDAEMKNLITAFLAHKDKGSHFSILPKDVIKLISNYQYLLTKQSFFSTNASQVQNILNKKMVIQNVGAGAAQQQIVQQRRQKKSAKEVIEEIEGKVRSFFKR